MKNIYYFKSLFRTSLIALCLLFMGVGDAWGDGIWVGNSYIVAQGTWYNANGSGQVAGSFHEHNFGHITSFTIGGQVQTYGQNDGSSNPATMYYRFDGDDESIVSVSLVWLKYESNNNWFQSSSLTNTVDLSGLTPGEHTIEVWFYGHEGSKDGYDSNGGSNYVANFTIDPYITFDKQSGSGGTTNITGTYGSATMPAITLPTYTGKKFEGYYTGQNGTGTQYYAYNGNSIHTCDFTTNPTLYANWKTPTEYTFYYAAPSDVVANNTVKCYVNYGYDQGAADVNMTATDKTYNNKRIYSVTVTANYQSFDGIYFKPKGWSGDGSEEQAANTSYVSASTISGKIYEHGVGWQTYAEDAAYTLYFVNYYDWATPKAYAWSSDYDKSCEYASSQAMTKTDYTYNGHDIYTITYTRGYTNVIFNNNSSGSAKTGDLGCYANKGKLYNGSSWQAYGRDITVYVVPEAIGYTSGTTYDPSTHNTRANVKVGDDEWLASWPIFTKTSYKYKSHWIYEARVLAKYNVIKTIQFWVFSGESKVASNSYYDCTPASQYVASDIDGKIFVGYDTDHHQWDTYGLDVALDQQSGSAGTSSITATVGSAMPAITLPGRDGYAFGGYWTEIGGGGTQYYNADGSSTRNWDSKTITTLYAKWTARNYTITLEDMTPTTAGQGSVTVTFNASTNMTSAVTKPTKTHYDFAGYWTDNDDSGATLVTQLIDANGNWIKNVSTYTGSSGDNATWIYPNGKSLFAKWTEHDYTITLNVTPTHVESSDPATGGTIQINSSSVTSVNAHFVSETAEITAVPSSPAYVFKEWQFSKTGEDYDVYVSPGHEYTSSSNPITIKAEHAGTLTAVFEPRYCLVGSKSNTSAAGNGMPGWSDYNNSATFFNVISTSPSINLTCTCSLDPNTQYKFQVHDRKYNGGTNYGYAPAGTTLPAGDSFLLDDANNDVYFDTKGRGTYVFKINNITESSGQYYPTVTIERPTSWQVSLGEGYVDIDGTTHSNSTTGGTMSATATESETTVAITNGQYITNGGTLSYSNTPNTGFTFSHWYGTADFSGGSFDFTSFAVESAPSVYAKFVETSTTVTLANDGHGKVQIGGEDATSTTCGVTTTRSIAAVANSGYSFNNWTTSASPDFEVASSTSATTTLTGHGAGTAGTLTANFTANNYTVDLENQGATSAGTTSVTATYDATLSSITCPTKTYYTFGGYFTEAGGAGTQIINADGSWKESVAGYTSETKQWIHVGDITLYAKWTENLYTVNVAVSPAEAGSVQVNSSNVTSVTNVGYATHSSVMTAVPTNAAWVFKEWQKTSAVNLDLEHYSTTGTTMEITATAADQTLTAVFQKRYELVGSVWDGESNGGMPGWLYDGTGEFTINSFTAVDTDNGVDLTYSCTLTSNTAYKLRINDRGASKVYGKNDPSADYYTLPANASAELSDYGVSSEDVWIQTGDASGLFTFRITKMRNAGEGNRYYPTLSVDRPQQVNFGRRRVDIDGGAHDDNIGGTLAVTKTSGGASVTSGDWLTYGTDVTYTTSATSGYTLTWYTSDAYSSTFSAGGIWSHALTSTDNCYAQFTEQAKTVTINKTGSGTITVGGSAFTWGNTKTCGVTTTRALVATAATGYSFTGWTVPDGVNFQLDDYAGGADNEVTLRGKTSGSTGTLTANFTANNYSVTLDNDHGNPSNNGSATATYDATSLSVSSHATFSSWTLLGYWNNTGVQTANADGSLIAGVADYTDGSAHWTKTSGATLYAHWSRSITLDDNGGSADGSVTVNYNQTTTSSVSAPTRNGYSVEGYYADNECTHKVMEPNGTLVNYTGYVESGKWVHQTATTLYAKWNANSYTVTLHNDHGDDSDDGMATVTYDATSLTVSKHATFDGWTLLGYWNNSAIKVVNADGSLIASVDGFTDGSAHWTKTDNAEVWAHWSRTITLNDNVEQRHNGSVSVTYKGAAASHTAPKSREGYTLDGYYAEAGCSTKVMNANGTLASGVSGYTDGSSNWTHKTAATLYAKWTSDHFIIYRTGDKDDDPRAALDDVESYGGGTITETIEFRMKVRDLDMWHTLCLPFTVSAVKVWDEDDGPAYYDIVPYYRSSGTFYTGHYIIRTPRQTTDLPIADFGDWRDPTSPTGYVPSKDTPYIIQWHDSYFSGKYISFFGAADQTIPSFSAGSAPSSDNVVNVCVNKSMQTGSVAGAYMLESDYGNGAWLRLDNASEERDIPPFECYLLVNNPTRARYMAIRPGMTAADTPTGWDDVVNSETKTHIVVYSISGICVTQYNDCSINEAGQRLSETYGEGLYILRADNESVKLMVGGK